MKTFWAQVHTICTYPCFCLRWSWQAARVETGGIKKSDGGPLPTCAQELKILLSFKAGNVFRKCEVATSSSWVALVAMPDCRPKPIHFRTALELQIFGTEEPTQCTNVNCC